MVNSSVLSSFLLTTTGLLLGNNQWSCWHWGKNTITARSAASGYWGNIISSELNQWDAGTCVSLTSGSEITGDAGIYGNTGWLGLARILEYDAGKCEILKAEALMNRTYLDGASYDETDDRHVTCQELGHGLGLDHRKGPRNQTCMNDVFLGFPDFDQHDADTLASITGGCSAGLEAARKMVAAVAQRRVERNALMASTMTETVSSTEPTRIVSEEDRTMTKTQFRTLAGVAVLAGIGAAALIAPRLKPYLQGPPAARAMWAETYETLGQMRAGADAIVVATVQGTRPGRTVQTPDGSLPFTLVDLVVEQSIRGETPSMITVEQTGGDANGETFLVDGDGGPYQTSQRVVLFLKQQPDTGYYYLVNPQGRFRIGADGRLNAAAPDDPVSQRLDTRTLQQADALIRSPE